MHLAPLNLNFSCPRPFISVGFKQMIYPPCRSVSPICLGDNCHLTVVGMTKWDRRVQCWCRGSWWTLNTSRHFYWYWKFYEEICQLHIHPIHSQRWLIWNMSEGCSYSTAMVPVWPRTVRHVVRALLEKYEAAHVNSYYWLCTWRQGLLKSGDRSDYARLRLGTCGRWARPAVSQLTDNSVGVALTTCSQRTLNWMDVNKTPLAFQAVALFRNEWAWMSSHLSSII